MSEKVEKITLKYCNPESKYAEFDYNGMQFYVFPFDPQFAYSLDEPNLMIRIERIDFKKSFIYVKEMIKL
ncbi:MAG: hypothetical protein LWW94_02140 [Candidatus Desulfofervidaceae bacterium]|nr:hypothetical protein [Candidatus Desulfofervidaceae bacterium]